MLLKGDEVLLPSGAHAVVTKTKPKSKYYPHAEVYLFIPETGEELIMRPDLVKLTNGLSDVNPSRQRVDQHWRPTRIVTKKGKPPPCPGWIDLFTELQGSMVTQRVYGAHDWSPSKLDEDK